MAPSRMGKEGEGWELGGIADGMAGWIREWCAGSGF